MSLLHWTGGLLWMIGLFSFWGNRRHLLLLLLFLEVLFLGLNLLWIGASLQMDDLTGQLFTLFILTLAAAEAALGLSLLISFSRVHPSLTVDLVGYLSR